MTKEHERICWACHAVYTGPLGASGKCPNCEHGGGDPPLDVWSLNMAKREGDLECTVMPPLGGKTLLELAVEERNRTSKPLLERLKAAGSTGCDLSPGDPLCADAAAEIECLRADNERLMHHVRASPSLSNQYVRLAETEIDAQRNRANGLQDRVATHERSEAEAWRKYRELKVEMRQDETAGDDALRAIARLLPYAQQHEPCDAFDLEAQMSVITEAEVLLAARSSVEPPRELSASEAASFDKTLARSPRRVVEPSAPRWRHDWETLPGPSYRCRRCTTTCLDAHTALLCVVEPKATLGIKVVVDPSMPPDEIVMRGANGQRVRVTGLAVPGKASANTAICKTCCQEFELHDGHKCPGLAEKATAPAWDCACNEIDCPYCANRNALNGEAPHE